MKTLDELRQTEALQMIGRSNAVKDGLRNDQLWWSARLRNTRAAIRRLEAKLAATKVVRGDKSRETQKP